MQKLLIAPAREMSVELVLQKENGEIEVRCEIRVMRCSAPTACDVPFPMQSLHQVESLLYELLNQAVPILQLQVYNGYRCGQGVPALGSMSYQGFAVHHQCAEQQQHPKSRHNQKTAHCCPFCGAM